METFKIILWIVGILIVIVMNNFTRETLIQIFLYGIGYYQQCLIKEDKIKNYNYKFLFYLKGNLMASFPLSVNIDGDVKVVKIGFKLWWTNYYFIYGEPKVVNGILSFLTFFGVFSSTFVVFSEEKIQFGDWVFVDESQIPESNVFEANVLQKIGTKKFRKVSLCGDNFLPYNDE